jgi:hypothetical protein
MRIIEVALRYSTLGYEIPLSISSLFLRREYGRVQRRAAEKRRNQTSNLGVGGSNPSERATISMGSLKSRGPSDELAIT